MQQLRYANVSNGGGADAVGCARQLLAAGPLIMRFLREQMRQRRHAGLTVPQFRALIFAHTLPAATLSDMAEHLGLSLPAASRLVAGLVRRGLLTRRARPENRRCVALRLTTRGETAYAAAYDGTREALARQLARLSARELGDVNRAAALLHTIFEAPPNPNGSGKPADGGGSAPGAGGKSKAGARS